MNSTRKLDFACENLGHLINELNDIVNELKDYDNIGVAYKHLEHAQMNLNMCKFTVHTVMEDIRGCIDEHYYY